MKTQAEKLIDQVLSEDASIGSGGEHEENSKDVIETAQDFTDWCEKENVAFKANYSNKLYVVEIVGRDLKKVIGSGTGTSLVEAMMKAFASYHASLSVYNRSKT